MSEVVVAWIASLAAVFLCAVMRPQRLTCPPGWYDYDGVRPTGEFTCAPRPTGPDWEPPTAPDWAVRPDPSSQPPARLHLWIYCTGGQRPVVGDDGRTVGCQRG